MRGTEKSREIEFTYEKLKSESSFPSFCLQFSSIGQIIRENSFQQKKKKPKLKFEPSLHKSAGFEQLGPQLKMSSLLLLPKVTMLKKSASFI